MHWAPHATLLASLATIGVGVDPRYDPSPREMAQMTDVMRELSPPEFRANVHFTIQDGGAIEDPVQAPAFDELFEDAFERFRGHEGDFNAWTSADVNASQRETLEFLERATSWEDLMQRYATFHRAVVDGELPPRYMVYSCNHQSIGLGNRMLGAMSSFLYALSTQRAFLIDYVKPVALDDFFNGMSFDWSLRFLTARDRFRALPDLPIEEPILLVPGYEEIETAPVVRYVGHKQFAQWFLPKVYEQVKHDPFINITSPFVIEEPTVYMNTVGWTAVGRGMMQELFNPTSRLISEVEYFFGVKHDKIRERYNRTVGCNVRMTVQGEAMYLDKQRALQLMACTKRWARTWQKLHNDTEGRLQFYIMSDSDTVKHEWAPQMFHPFDIYFSNVTIIHSGGLFIPDDFSDKQLEEAHILVFVEWFFFSELPFLAVTPDSSYAYTAFLRKLPMSVSITSGLTGFSLSSDEMCTHANFAFRLQTGV